MDSWYLLHILLNVGRVAAMGYEDAAKVFLASVDYAVKGAPFGSGPLARLLRHADFQSSESRDCSRKRGRARHSGALHPRDAPGLGAKS